ncbi:response regulator [Massilia sp. PAMC28688]|uniref:response regulator n=1 Tax=Massilia sp. PAMC28688 TaxID=2861283 RepID=UPI001C6331AF|nr:response regulator [Massilia sp. PAMC28688]QYF95618.1 response regulator [Massilia sp. PAMC28688]
MNELKRILYVEDDPDIQMVAQMALEVVGGFTLRACSSGHEALQAAAGFAPDLILLDVMMPGLDGPATLARLRELEATATTPAIFMTAKVQPAEVTYFKSLGAAGVIAKPFDPMDLPQQVRRLWQEGGA